MKASRCAFVATLGLAFVASASAQSQRTPNTLKLDGQGNSPPAKVADVAWLAGHWRGEGLGGTIEEIWAPPLGGSMMGMFRLVQEGKLIFSEMFFIFEENGSLVLKLKHFDAAFKGWEEKDAYVTFQLVKLSPDEVYFDGLTLRKKPDGSLEGFVAIHDKKTGETREEKFVYRPVK